MALGLSAALLIPGYFLLAPKLHPEFNPARAHTDAKPIDLEGSLFRPVIAGESEQEGSSTIIRELAAAEPDDHAVLVHRRLFQASRYPFLRYHIEGRNPALQVIVFWQRLDAPGENFFLELDYSGEGPTMHNMLRSEEWKGTITELAVGYFGDLRGEAVKLHEVRLEPYSNLSLLQVVWGEWTRLKTWDQTSINVHRGASEDALIYPVPVTAAWVGLAVALVVLTRLITGHSRLSWGGAIAVTLIGWFALDGLWLRQLYWQNAETRYLFAGKSLHEKKLADWDGEYYAAALAIKRHLGSSSSTTVPIYHAWEHRALAGRLRFHLLPEVKTSMMPNRMPWHPGQTNKAFDYVIIQSAPNTTVSTDEHLRRILAGDKSSQWEPLWHLGPIALYATNRENQRKGHE